MRRLLDMGADAINTDRPDRLMDALGRGYTLRP
jgi:glycerophosphoryl diester phosphodiesterase